MNDLLPIIRRKRRPLAPGERAVVSPRKPALLNGSLASADSPPATSARMPQTNLPLPVRFDAARPFTRRPEFGAVELQPQRRERHGGHSGMFLVTQGDDKLITQDGHFLVL